MIQQLKEDGIDEVPLQYVDNRKVIAQKAAFTFCLLLGTSGKVFNFKPSLSVGLGGGGGRFLR